MHDMQTTVADECGVCPSVCLSVTRINSTLLCKNGLTDQDSVWGEHSWNTWNSVLDDGSWGQFEPTAYLRNDPGISGMAEVTDLKFCVRREDRRP